MNTQPQSAQRHTGWFKSSFSNPAQDCVEVRFEVGTVLIRDSKQHGNGPVLTTPHSEWASFLADATRGASSPTARVRITHHDDGGADLHHTADPSTMLSYTPSEWDAFLAGIHNHEFQLQAA